MGPHWFGKKFKIQSIFSGLSAGDINLPVWFTAVAVEFQTSKHINQRTLRSSCGIEIQDDGPIVETVSFLLGAVRCKK